jgi:hypothetical protein
MSYETASMPSLKMEASSSTETRVPNYTTSDYRRLKYKHSHKFSNCCEECNEYWDFVQGMNFSFS